MASSVLTSMLPLGMPNGLTPLIRSTESLLPASRFSTYSEAPSLEAQPLNGDDEGIPVSELVDLPLNLEDDDAFHRPRDEEDDGVGEGCADLCSPSALANLSGLLLMTFVVVAVFVGVPLWAFFDKVAAEA